MTAYSNSPAAPVYYGDDAISADPYMVREFIGVLTEYKDINEENRFNPGKMQGGVELTFTNVEALYVDDGLQYDSDDFHIIYRWPMPEPGNPVSTRSKLHSFQEALS